MKRNERGFTLVEVNLAMLISAVILAAAASLVITLLRDASHVEARVRVQNEVSTAFERLVREVRDASAADTSGVFADRPIRELSATRLVFTAEVAAGQAGEELLTYEVTNCVDGECDLVRTVRASAGIVSGVTDYGTGTTLQSVAVVTNVVEPTAATALFEGVDWTGGTRAVTSTCDSAGVTPCTFSAIDVDISVELFIGNSRAQSFTEFVRIRNSG